MKGKKSFILFWSTLPYDKQETAFIVTVEAAEHRYGYGEAGRIICNANFSALL